MNPIPASSGDTTRHRLNRGGDRRLNRALNVIAMVRMVHHPQTRAYADGRRAEGKTDRESAAASSATSSDASTVTSTPPLAAKLGVDEI